MPKIHTVPFPTPRPPTNQSRAHPRDRPGQNVDAGPSHRKLRGHRGNRTAIQTQRRSRSPPIEVRLSRPRHHRSYRRGSAAAVVDCQAPAARHSLRVAGATDRIRLQALTLLLRAPVKRLRVFLLDFLLPIQSPESSICGKRDTKIGPRRQTPRTGPSFSHPRHGDTVIPRKAPRIRARSAPEQEHAQKHGLHGWGGRTRTSEWRNQNLTS